MSEKTVGVVESSANLETRIDQENAYPPLSLLAGTEDDSDTEPHICRGIN
ncbi:hypothetical protein ACFRKE_03055 [Kitasatospora indigofera]